MLRPVVELSASDMKALFAKLKETEPGLVRDFRKEVKAIAKPVDDEIKRLIPQQPPLSGMGFVIRRESRVTGNISYSTNEGRLNWLGTGAYNDGTSKSKAQGPRSTTIRTGIRPSGRSLTTALAKIILDSPAVSMADMAGRGGNGRNGVRSREYTYRKRNGEIVKRRHMVNGQGVAMIRELSAKYQKASRFGWRALEGKIDTVANEIDKVIQKYLDRAYK